MVDLDASQGSDRSTSVHSPQVDDAGGDRPGGAGGGGARASEPTCGNGQGISRRTCCLSAAGSLVVLYLKIRGIPGANQLPWLLVLSPPWLSGLWVLFKVSIPRMLTTVEGALGVQLSSDRLRVAGISLASWRQPLQGREWEQVDPKP
jgi:hypothetical protein